MKEEKNYTMKKLGAQFAKRILPFFAPLFLANVAAPSETVTAKSAFANYSRMDALKHSNFQMNILEMYESMGLEQQGLSLKVFDEAVMGYLNMKGAGMLSEKPLLTVIDFDKPSSEKRFWVIDLKAKKVLYHTYVSHGRNSGDNVANRFSNVNQSNMSSLGFYVTENTYTGRHGTSLVINGMDENYNTNAKSRNVVIHGADYVNEGIIKALGRLGRSQGCPALSMKEYLPIIELVQGGTTLFIHASGQPYNSRFLNQQTAMESFYANENII